MEDEGEELLAEDGDGDGDGDQKENQLEDEGEALLAEDGEDLMEDSQDLL